MSPSPPCPRSPSVPQAPSVPKLPARWRPRVPPAGAQPPLLMLDPPWTPLFKEQKVILTCAPPNERVPTLWNINGRTREGTSRLQFTPSSTGRYSFQCWRSWSEPSPPLKLSISDDWWVLQAPVQPVLEGDELVLRCRSRWDLRPSSVSFFRNGELLRGPGGQEDTLLLAPAQRHHGGRYHCTGRGYWSRFETKPNEVVVHELFSVPELSVEGSREPPEGSNLTLVCVTRSSPLRPPVTLQHLFYQDGVVVGGPQGSPRHQLQVLALRDSGSYACEARAEAAKVQKRSNPVTITVRSERLGGGRITPPGPPVPPVLSQVPPICSPGPNTHPGAPSLGPSILTPRTPLHLFVGSPHRTPHPPSLPRSPHPLWVPTPFLGPAILPQVPPPLSGPPHPFWVPPSFPRSPHPFGSPHPSQCPQPPSIPIPPPPPPLSAGVPVAGVALAAQPPRGAGGPRVRAGSELPCGGGARGPLFSPGTGRVRTSPWPRDPATSCRRRGRRTVATTCAGPPTASPRPTAPSCRSPSWVSTVLGGGGHSQVPR
uniref:Ig-like domain-containing protein n=1 Tax=Anas platyrhynchos platyrhynchos TaxID=8840 RepID=A0A493T145_ANAPP